MRRRLAHLAPDGRFPDRRTVGLVLAGLAIAALPAFIGAAGRYWWAATYSPLLSSAISRYTDLSLFTIPVGYRLLMFSYFATGIFDGLVAVGAVLLLAERRVGLWIASIALSLLALSRATGVIGLVLTSGTRYNVLGTGTLISEIFSVVWDLLLLALLLRLPFPRIPLRGQVRSFVDDDPYREGTGAEQPAAGESA